MAKPLDPDVKALTVAMRALDGSSSLQMIHVNVEYLWDRYIGHPSQTTIEHFAVKTRAAPTTGMSVPTETNG
jgi:hypothetical protein